MSIENHNWVDPDIEVVEANQKTIQIEHECPSSSVIEIHKKDSLAIAKHFGQDDEFLVLKLDELKHKYLSKISGDASIPMLMGKRIEVESIIKELEKLTGESK